MPIMNKMITVDLGALSWTRHPGQDRTKYWFRAFIPNPKQPAYSTSKARLICPMYENESGSVVYSQTQDKTIAIPNDNPIVMIVNNDYNDVESFKAAMSGVMLTYETVDTVEECIINSIKKDNILSHSWLLSGTQGPGHFYTTTVNYAFIDNPIIYIDGYEYKGTRSALPWWDSSDKSFTIYKGANENIREIYIHDSSCDTLDEFLQSATGKKITYQVNPYEEVIL